MPPDVLRLSTPARLVQGGLRALRRAGVPGAAGLSDGDLAVLAFDGGEVVTGLTDGSRLRPSWSTLEAAWAAAPALPARRPGPPITGARLLPDNAAAFDERSMSCARARRRIRLCTYALHADTTGERAAADLLEAAKRGVQVQLLLDRGIAVKEWARAPARAERLLDQLRSGGVELQLWRRPTAPWVINHRKLLVVDDEVAIIGGRNLGEHYSGDRWRDVELVVEGGPCAAMGELFDRMWDEGAGSSPPPETAASWSGEDWMLLAHEPLDEAAWPDMRWVLHALARARTTVDIEHAYLWGFAPLCAAVVAAVARGVRVRLLTNSPESNDLLQSRGPAFWSLRPMVAAGAELWVRRGRGRTLHAKYTVVDGREVLLGSTNLSPSSARVMLEVALASTDDAIGAALGEFFESGLAEADRVPSVAALEARYPPTVKGRLLGWFLRNYS